MKFLQYIGAFLLVTFMPIALSAHTDEQAITIVVNNSISINNISKEQLQKIFLGKLHYIDGVRLIPFNLPTSNIVRDAFDLKLLGLAPNQVEKYWIDRRLRGRGKPPRTVSSYRVLKKLIKNFPGAIGYLPASEIVEPLKIITIDNKAYTSEDYLLKIKLP